MDNLLNNKKIVHTALLLMAIVGGSFLASYLITRYIDVNVNKDTTGFVGTIDINPPTHAVETVSGGDVSNGFSGATTTETTFVTRAVKILSVSAVKANYDGNTVVITIRGSGFSVDNTVRIGGKTGLVFYNVPSTENGTVIIFETATSFLDREFKLARRENREFSFSVSSLSFSGELQGSSNNFYTSENVVYSEGSYSGNETYDTGTVNTSVSTGGGGEDGGDWWNYFIATETQIPGAFPFTPGGVYGPQVPYSTPVIGGIADGKGGIIPGIEILGIPEEIAGPQIPVPVGVDTIAGAAGIGAAGSSGGGGEARATVSSVGVGGVAVTPFGGKVMSIIYCTCSASILLNVGVPRPASVLVTLATQIYSNYNIESVGQWVLGNYIKGTTPCTVYVPPAECVSAGAPMGIVTQIGTSIR